MRVFAALLVVAGAAVFLLARCVEDTGTEPRGSAALRIEASLVNLSPGDTARLMVGAWNADGKPIPFKRVKWWSSDPEIAIVDSEGLITGVAAGSAWVGAVLGRVRDSVSVTVGPAILVGAGDIASCDVEGDEETARLLDRIPGTVFTTGDNAYPDGTAQEFADCYHPSWGRHKHRTRPSIGNHDYRTDRGGPYYEYFGAAAGPAGKGYYSYDLGGWHIVVLNSETAKQSDPEQLAWLREDLAAHPARCILAYWHHPLFSSLSYGGTAGMKPYWEALYEAGAEIVLNGHDHFYERYAPQTPSGEPDPERGIRQFVVGTGGQRPAWSPNSPPNREVHDGKTNGVLKLSLFRDHYTWEFIPAGNGTFTDKGRGECH